MGILELIKLQRILICSLGDAEDEDGYLRDEDILTLKFEINPDYTPTTEESESEKNDESDE
jgi:hypothetical protein